MRWDCLIMGKGPAGISAALYLQRAGLSTLAMGKDLGALEKAENIQNYYGFPGGISGKELAERGIQQAQELGAVVCSEEIISIEQEPEGFLVRTTQKEYQAETILLAAGKSRRSLSAKGFDRLAGHGISFCAVCDGFLYRGKRLALIGSGPYAAEEYSVLRRFTQQIALFSNGQPVTGEFPQELEIVSYPINEAGGEQRVEFLRAGDKEYPVDGIFVAMGTASASDFAVKLGLFTEQGNIVKNPDYSTSLEGVFAAGDCVGGFLQVSTAVGEGALAAQSIIRYLKKKQRV